MSTPLTPLSHTSDFVYSLAFPADPLDFSNLDAELNEAVDGDAWAVAHGDLEMDVDVTPRVASDGHEKSLAQVESELLHE